MLGLVLLLVALAATVISVGGPGELMDMDDREMGVEVGAFSIAGGVLLYRILARRRI